MINNYALINKATITTDSVTSGILNPEQAKKFLVQAFDSTALKGFVRHETRVSQTGEIDKIGIKSRILRKKTENTDDGERIEPEYDKIEYGVTPVRVPWEITEETLRQNIEGQQYEGIVTNLMTTQIGLDQEDLCLNGDTATESSDDDYDFLKINDGWLKQVEEKGHIVDRGPSGGTMNLNLFYDALQAIPNKYNNGRLKWLMSPYRYQEWERYILNEAVTSGGIITDKRVENPGAIPAIKVPSMPNDKIMLTCNNNLIVVNTYGVIIRKTTEGKEAIMQDKRFYVVHFDFDPIIEETDATVMIKGLV